MSGLRLARTRCQIRHLILVLVLMAMVAETAVVTGNGLQDESIDGLIQNGAIDGPDHWTTRYPHCSYDAEIGHEQNGSLLVDHNELESTDFGKVPFSFWLQEIDVPDDVSDKLKIEAWFRATDFRDFANARLFVFFYSENGEQIGDERGGYVQADCDWTNVAVIFEPPENCTSVKIHVHMQGHGRLWIDDFKISETTESQPYLPFPRPPETGYWQPLRKSAEDIPWQFDLDEALEQSQETGKPILVYVRSVEARDEGLVSAQSSLQASGVWAMDDGFQKDVMFRAGPLSEPHVSALIQRRFVPVILTYQFPRDRKSEIVPTVTGDDAITPALIILGDSGEIVARVHRIGVYSGDHVDQWLRHGLKRAAAASTATDPGDLYLDGELNLIVENTKGQQDDQFRLLRARALTRLGRLAEATESIGELELPAVSLQRAVIAMRDGEWTEAISHLDEIDLEESPELREEVVFRHGWCLHRTGSHSRAAELWHSVRGDTLMGRKALACLTMSQDPKLWMLGSERLWSRDNPLATSTEVGQAGEFLPDDSVRILLELQRENGSWGWNETGPLWSGAMTALSAEALWRWQAGLPEDLRSRSLEAQKRAIAYLESILTHASRIDTFNFPYMLDHFLRTDNREPAQKMVDHLVSMQTESGAWTYRHDCVTSFNTADVLVALSRARTAGLDVPDESIERGAEALYAMRSTFSKNNFPYSPSRNFINLSKSDPHGSIARDPMCEYALLLADNGDEELYAAALKRFIQHESMLREPTKQYSGYFNDNAHGSYFFFYGHFNALQAAELASPELRTEVEEAVLRAILSAREQDGSSIDNFMYGRAYGTAVTLVITGRLRDTPVDAEREQQPDEKD
ncbi:MAG: hypothetical protein ACR2NP_07610 [Pirellulaceae bacterium]